MTLSIPQARLLVHGIDSGIFVRADSYEPKGSETLRCPDRRCRAALGWVRAHSRNGRWVDAFFRRHPGVEHSSGCRFNLDETVTRLIARSERIDGPGGLLARMPDGSAIVRLDIFRDALVERARMPDTLGKASPGYGTGSADLAKSERQIRLRLRTAWAVIALMARLGFGDELRAAIRITHEGQDLRWDDFFYGPGELDRLFRHLRTLNETGRPPHPVAVVVETRAVLGEPGPDGDTLIGCRYQSAGNFPKAGLRVSPTLVCKSRVAAGHMSKRGHYLICGVPRPAKKAFEPSLGRGRIDYAQIYVTIGSRNQYARWPC